MINFIKSKYYLFIELFILLIISFVPLIWFTPNHMVLGMDSGYPIDFIGYFNQRLFSWFSSWNFGVDMSFYAGQIPLFAILAFVKSIGFSVYDVQKVTFVFWFFAIAASIYTFIYNIFPLKKYWSLRLVTVFLYVFNLYLFSFWTQGEQTTLSSFVMLPLVTLLFIKFFREELSALKSAVLLNLVYFLFNSGGIFGFPLLGATILSVLSLISFYLYISKTRVRQIKRLIALSLISLIIFPFLNAYFIFPPLFTFSKQFNQSVQTAGGLESVVSWSKFVSSNASFSNLFRLQGDNNWYNHLNFFSNAYLENPFLIIASLAFPVLSYLSLLLIKKKKERIIPLFFVFLSLIAIVFSAGAYGPFADFYILLLRKIPGFAAFRSPYYKFVPALYFSFSVLFGISTFYITQKFNPKIKYLIVIFLLLFICIYNYPFFQKSNFVFSKPFTTMLKIPDYLQEFAKINNESKDYSRILVVPPFNDNSSLKIYNWNYFSADPIFKFSDKNFIYNDVNMSASERKMVSLLYQSLRTKDFAMFKNLARYLNINYVLLTEDVVDDYESAPTEDPNLYKIVLDNDDNFNKLWQKGKWTLYGFKGNVSNKVYATDTSSLSVGGIENIGSLVSPTGGAYLIPNEINNNFLSSNFPISRKITSIDCLSCGINSANNRISLADPEVLPGSVFYQLKIFKDNLGLNKALNKFSDENQRIDYFLGSSLKRIAEIKTLKKVNEVNISEKEWGQSINLLRLYWKNINSILLKKDRSDEDLYTYAKRIYDYGSFEEKIIRGVYGPFSSPTDALGIQLADSLWEMQNSIAFAQEIVNKYDWDKTFAYRVPTGDLELNIDKTSLPKSLQGESIFPSRYLLGSGEARLQEGNTIRINNNKEKVLTLFFDSIPNLLGSLQETKISLPMSSYNCLYSQIDNYSWINKYIVTAKIVEGHAAPKIFIKRNHEIFPSENIISPNSNYFKADNIFEVKDSDNINFSYKFQGEPNDKNANVYFCTIQGHDPKMSFKEISVKQTFAPVIYFENKQSIAKKNLPQISFKRLSPISYSVNVKNSTDPFVLVFSEAFSPFWKIYVPGEHKEIPGEHFEINGYANGWYLDKQGTYQIEIRYSLQEILQLGFATTIVALAISLFYLVSNFFVAIIKKYGNS